MKNIFSICMSTMILLSGCNDDFGLQNNPIGEQQQVIRIAAHMENDKSRLSIAELNDKLDLRWSTGDVLKVINPSASNSFTNFTLSDGSFTTSGEFVGTPTIPYQNGDELYVLYHNNLVEADIDNEGNVSIVLKEQDGTKDQDYFLMYGKTTYDAEKGMQMVFMKHLVSIIKLSITTDKTLNRIEFDGGHTFRTKGTLVLKNSPSNSDYEFKSGELAYCCDDDGAEVDYEELSVSGTFSPVNGKVSVYYYLLPSKSYKAKDENSEEKFDWADEPWIGPQFRAFDSEGNQYSCIDYYSIKSVEQGKMYELNTSLFKLEKFENESTADGSETSPYQISNAAQLYTFMLRCQTEEKIGDKRYNELCYELTNDIELDGSVFWRSVNLYNNGSFDGKNYTISGVKENWLFDEVYNGAKIRNIKLNVQATLKKTGRSYYGVLASRVSGDGTEVVNCHNLGNINVEFYNDYAGTLVGILEQNATMIGCSNTGNLTVVAPISVGGLVGRICSGATMEACYSDGVVTINNGDWDKNIYAGGLVGMIDTEENSTEFPNKTNMISCWNNVIIEISNTTNTHPIQDIAGNDEDGNLWSYCYKSPTETDLETMNKNMTNEEYRFGENGVIVSTSSSEGNE